MSKTHRIFARTGLILIAGWIISGCTLKHKRAGEMSDKSPPVQMQECTLAGMNLQNAKLQILTSTQGQAITVIPEPGRTLQFVMMADGRAGQITRNKHGEVTAAYKDGIAERYNSAYRRTFKFWTEEYPKSPAAIWLKSAFTQVRSKLSQPTLAGGFSLAPSRSQSGEAKFSVSASIELNELDRPTFIPAPGEKTWLHAPLPIDVAYKGSFKVLESQWHQKPYQPSRIRWRKGFDAATDIELDCSQAHSTGQQLPAIVDTKNIAPEDLFAFEETQENAVALIPLQLATHALLQDLDAKDSKITPKRFVSHLTTGFQLFCSEFAMDLDHDKKTKKPLDASLIQNKLEDFFARQPHGPSWGETLGRMLDTLGIDEELAGSILAKAAWDGCVRASHPEMRLDSELKTAQAPIKRSLLFSIISMRSCAPRADARGDASQKDVKRSLALSEAKLP